MSLLDIAMAVADATVGALPRAQPTREALLRCRLVAHRGAHDNRQVLENTLPAFRAARDAGVWGIECDIRWTADLVPVICHDVDTRRVFHRGAVLRETNWADLRRDYPQIPSLEEVVGEFGGRTHLMLELKAEAWPQPRRQRDTLRQLLAPLAPVDHYHLLALDPDLFERAGAAPAPGCVPVAQGNIAQLSRTCLQRGYGGFAGHYLLLSERMRRRHAAAGQRLGTGFPASRNCLYRELNRDIDWIFSNHAVQLQQLRDAQLGSG